MPKPDRFKSHNLVSSNKVTYDSDFEDPTLRNGWDIKTFNDDLWVTSANAKKLIRYDITGNHLAEYPLPSRPTGLVLNPVRALGSNLFYIATDNGEIFAFNPSLQIPIHIVVKNAFIGSVFTGITFADKVLYVTDF